MSTLDIGAIFAIHVSPAELVLRGTLMYWSLLLIFRFVLRRDSGSLGVADILFVVIIADASQNAMSGGYDTFAEGMVLIGTLVFWNYALDWAAWRWPIVHQLTDPPPLPVIRGGRMIRRNMRREFLTPEDVAAQLRQQGIDDIGDVRLAFLEGDGKFSVIRYKTAQEIDRPRANGDDEPPGA